MTPDNKYMLAIDLGTSGPKTAIVDTRGKIMGTGHATVETILLPGDGVEQDPAEVWTAVKHACRQAVISSKVPAADIIGVLCASQYSSVVPVDAEGQPTMNMILWLDQRGDTKRLKKSAGFPSNADNPYQLYRWLRIHGLPPVGGGSNSLAHMRWVKYARPDVYERTTAFLEPMDFVALKFTGRSAANQCTAFMMLTTDNRRLNLTHYNHALVEYSKIDADKFPELLPLDAIVGTVLPDVADELGLSAETKVVAGVNDTQVGGISTAAFKGNHAGISLGSSGVLITHVGFKKTDVRHAILSMPSPVPDTYFMLAENGVGGIALDRFLENIVFADDLFGELSSDDKYYALNRVVDSIPPGSNGVLFLPWMSGSLAPHADPLMRGGFLNISMQTTRSELTRAVLEGVAMNMRWLRPYAERFAKRTFSHFVYYGGGAMMDDWAQIMADVLGSPVHQMENPRYANCIGAAFLGFERLGYMRFEDVEPLIPIKRIYEPRAEHQKTYDRLFAQFVRSFKRNRSIFRALNSSGR